MNLLLLDLIENFSEKLDIVAKEVLDRCEEPKHDICLRLPHLVSIGPEGERVKLYLLVVHKLIELLEQLLLNKLLRHECLVLLW